MLCLHFLQTQRNQLNQLLGSLEMFCKILVAFGFNRSKFDLSLIKSYLPTNIVNEKNIETTVIKKPNQLIPFNFVDKQLMDTLNFLGGATRPDSFLKAYKCSERERFFPYEWFDHPDKMQNTDFPPSDPFYVELRSYNTLEIEYNDFFDLLKKGWTTEQAFVDLNLLNPLTSGVENHRNLQQILKLRQMGSFKVFLWCFNNKDVVPTLEAIRKKVAFYRDKDIDMLTLLFT